MTWTVRLKQNLFYGGLTKEEYAQVRESILEHNRSSVVSWSTVLGSFWIYTLLMSLKEESYANCRIAYAVGLACCVFTLVCSVAFANRYKWMRYPLMVLFDLAFLGASVGIAAFQPDARSITMFVAVIIIPICYVDRTAPVLVILLINLAWYIFIGSRMIIYEIYLWGLGNLIIFSTAGLLIGYVINRSRYERYVYAESVRKLADMKIAKEAADQANTAKSEFLANMSHEIRTPINAMLGMNEMVLRESMEPGRKARMPEKDVRKTLSRIRDYSVNISNAGQSLLSIVNDILDFSRIESGKMRITEAEYSLSSVLNDICSMFSLRAAEKSLEFPVCVDSGIPDILYGDEVRLRQILNNLLSNAFKYTKEGSVTLSIRRTTDSGSPPDGMIRLEISVEDTGAGIRKEDLDKVFNKFERVDMIRNSTVQGAGLGLAITRNLIEMMNGSIQVESVYGKGSVFRVSLPQRIVSDNPIGEFRHHIFDNSLLNATIRPMSFSAPDARILVVDDTQINLLVTVGLLQDTGIRIDTASRGAEAVQMAETTPYDLILMDQRMPEMDGTEAMNRIRKGKGPNVQAPFICLTADAVTGAREHYLSKGFTDYLSKPVSGADLEKAVKKYLPAGKILPAEKPAEDIPETDGPATAEDRNTDYSVLRQGGINPAEGLANSQGRHDLYRELLCVFALDAGEKAGNLNRCCEMQNWKDYTVFVHALKSSARLIGAGELSRMAAELEEAAKAGDAATVRAGHSDMIAAFEQAAEAVRAAPFFKPAAGDDSEPEIMDFPAVT